jgi:short-subunit dehydrogenase
MTRSDFAARYGPWALITGGSDGIGLAFARRLADAGVKLILVGRSTDKLHAAAAQLRGLGAECVTASVDLGAADAAARIAQAVGDREVGLLITNAGADPNGSRFLDQDIAAWDALVTMNVNTTMHLAHHFGRAMKARGRGGMILVSSGACYGGMNGIAAYCASKGFVLNFAEGLWAELRHDGVDVLTLVLGRTDTPSHRKLLEESGQIIPEDMAMPEEVAEVGLRQLPHGPIWNWGQANDIAGMAPNSPDDRRAKIVFIEQMSAAYTART